MAQTGARLAVIKFMILLVLLSACLGCESHYSSRSSVAFGSTGSSELNWKAGSSSGGGVHVLCSLFNGKKVSKDELKKFNASIVASDSAGRTLKELKTVDCRLSDGTLTIEFSASELKTVADVEYLKISCELTFKEMNVMGGVHGGVFANKIAWSQEND